MPRSDEQKRNAQAENNRTLLRRLGFSFAIVVVFASGIVLTLVGHSGMVLASIGLNLIASAIFAAIFTLLSSNIQDQVTEQGTKERHDDLSQLIEEKITEVPWKILSGLAEQNKMHLPTQTYPPHASTPEDRYGKKYNTDMTRSIQATKFYAFQGQEARYVAARLRHSRCNPETVLVALTDPRDSRAMNRRAADRMRLNSKNEDKKIEDYIQQGRDELMMSIISLFDYRKIHSINLLYAADTSVYRFEMFDDAVYITWLHGPRSSDKEFPESMRFSNDSFIYQYLRDDLQARFEYSEYVFKQQGDDFLITHLNFLGLCDEAKKGLEHWRKEYQEHIKKFTDYLNENMPIN